MSRKPAYPSASAVSAKAARCCPRALGRVDEATTGTGGWAGSSRSSPQSLSHVERVCDCGARRSVGRASADHPAAEAAVVPPVHMPAGAPKEGTSSRTKRGERARRSKPGMPPSVSALPPPSNARKPGEAGGGAGPMRPGWSCIAEPSFAGCGISRPPRVDAVEINVRVKVAQRRCDDGAPAPGRT
ncbi:hypothetical protein T492DRAFT_1024763 [Pavlovales sp. CCMP2436]|nr:hypothetical protein T492DRAFT_1024763 [Pavlovales sp. CCMP2436]